MSGVNWSKGQVEAYEAYAMAFREGDAAKIESEWYEVVSDDESGSSYTIHSVNGIGVEENMFLLNYFNAKQERYVGVVNGFGPVERPYRIVTPEDYEVQEMDKLVWLGDSNEYLTFGKAYGVFRSITQWIVYLDNKGIECPVEHAKRYGGAWGVIPKWENVKEEKGVMSDVCKFSVGDVVRIAEDESLMPHEKEFVGSEVEIVDIISGEKCFPYGVDIPGTDGLVWFEESALELVRDSDSSERLAEYQALDYLLNQGIGLKEELAKEVIEQAKRHLEELDFKEVRKAIDIAEQLAGEQSTEE